MAEGVMLQRTASNTRQEVENLVPRPVPMENIERFDYRKDGIESMKWHGRFGTGFDFETLNLSDEQKSSLEEIKQSLESALIEVKSRLISYPANRAEALRRENFVLLRKLATDFHEELKLIALLKLDFTENLFQILTPEQKEIYKAQIRKVEE